MRHLSIGVICLGLAFPATAAAHTLTADRGKAAALESARTVSGSQEATVEAFYRLDDHTFLAIGRWTRPDPSGWDEMPEQECLVTIHVSLTGSNDSELRVQTEGKGCT
jgi:hypothetical protein